ncbi:hypothetical protein SAMN05444410_101563 [Hydrobacter penzbergensis]|uniref:Uncharacterized protein n=1 Tax=Hydrobacter penzbergensis TaxID=1235997 RepID=A0A8X8ICN4_9BACT|nr:hypothetical protein SAMN05444410_101563 [Hydrobacter penzbergensis]
MLGHYVEILSMFTDALWNKGDAFAVHKLIKRESELSPLTLEGP